MSKYSRGYTSPEEEANFRLNTQKILHALMAKPCTNKELHKGMGLDPSRCIFELRKKGWFIRGVRLENKPGVWIYTLMDGPDPAYEVGVRTTFPDGHVHYHTKVVNADNEAKAKNIAQHKGIERKIMSVQRIAPLDFPDPQPWTPDSGFQPKPENTDAVARLYGRWKESRKELRDDARRPG
jgi:hypothetical protein